MVDVYYAILSYKYSIKVNKIVSTMIHGGGRCLVIVGNIIFSSDWHLLIWPSYVHYINVAIIATVTTAIFLSDYRFFGIIPQ